METGPVSPSTPRRTGTVHARLEKARKELPLTPGATWRCDLQSRPLWWDPMGHALVPGLFPAVPGDHKGIPDARQALGTVPVASSHQLWSLLITVSVN